MLHRTPMPAGRLKASSRAHPLRPSPRVSPQLNVNRHLAGDRSGRLFRLGRSHSVGTPQALTATPRSSSWGREGKLRSEMRTAGFRRCEKPRPPARESPKAERAPLRPRPPEAGRAVRGRPTRVRRKSARNKGTCRVRSPAGVDCVSHLKLSDKICMSILAGCERPGLVAKLVPRLSDGIHSL